MQLDSLAASMCTITVILFEIITFFFLSDSEIKKDGESEGWKYKSNTYILKFGQINTFFFRFINNICHTTKESDIII